MGLQFFQICIFREVLGKQLVSAEGLQIDEDGIPFHLSRIGNLQMIGVGEHGHYLFAHLLLGIGQINAVMQGFAHLGLSVRAGKAQAGFVGGKKSVRLHQGITVNRIEFAHDLLGLFDHGKLILSDRNRGGPKGGDVGCLADGIGEKAHGNAGLEVPHLDLGFYRGVALESGNCDQVHIIKRQFAQLRDL